MTHAHPHNAATVEVKCARCKMPFMARVADRKRGWGKFCSKSCKAVKQTQQGGRRSNLPRPNGLTPMLHKNCDVCGSPAVNGVYTNDRDHPIQWGCALHHDTTPFIDGHGQW